MSATGRGAEPDGAPVQTDIVRDNRGHVIGCVSRTLQRTPVTAARFTYELVIESAPYDRWVNLGKLAEYLNRRYPLDADPRRHGVEPWRGEAGDIYYPGRFLFLDAHEQRPQQSKETA